VAIWRNTVYVERVHDSPDTAINGKQSRSTRVIDVPSVAGRGPEVAVQAVKDFVGYTRLVSQAGTKYLNRITPHQHPTWPWLYCTQAARVEGVAFREKWDQKGDVILFGDKEGVEYLTFGHPVSHYQVYRLHLVYEALTWDVQSDKAAPGRSDESDLTRYVTKITRPGGDYISLPSNGLASVPVDGGEASQPAPVGLGKILPSFDVEITWHQVPYDAVPSREVNSALAAPAIENSIGKVNTVALGGFEKGCLLFLACDKQPDRMSEGTRSFNVVYRLKYIPLDTAAGMNADIGSHNSLPFKIGTSIKYREVTPDGVTAALTVANKHLYDGADLRKLFQPGV
jgi:hypothetical protein